MTDTENMLPDRLPGVPRSADELHDIPRSFPVAVAHAIADELDETPRGPELRELATETDTTEAGLPGQTIRVVLETGEEWSARTSNKDYVRWDKTAPARRAGVKNFADAPFIFAAFLGWSAGRRMELTSLTFDQFLDLADVVERVESAEVPPTQ